MWFVDCSCIHAANITKAYCQYHQYVKQCVCNNTSSPAAQKMLSHELKLIPKHGLVQTAKHACHHNVLAASVSCSDPVSCACSELVHKRWMVTYAESSFAVSLT